MRSPSSTLTPYRVLAESESSAERFDRIAYAEQLVALVKPPTMRVAIGPGRTHVVVELGRAWGRSEGARWALLLVPPTASRRAIAEAVAALAGPEPEPYLLDTVMAGLAAAE